MGFDYNYDFWSKVGKFESCGTEEQRMVGKAIDSAIEERRLMADRAEAKKDRQLKRDVINYNYAQKLVKDMDDRNIMPTSGVRGMDEIVTAASRTIADQAAYLESERARTQDNNAYAQAMARLNSDVDNVKLMDKGAKAFLGAYNTALENNNMSDFNSVDLKGIAEDMRSGSPEGRFENKNGVMTWVSKNPLTNEDYSVAVSEFEQLSKRFQSKDDIDTLLKGTLTLNQSTGGNILSFDQDPVGMGGSGLSAADMAYNSLTDLIDQAGPDNKERKSAALLVDHFGVSSDEAKRLFTQVLDQDQLTDQEKNDGILTEGDRLLQQKWLNKARNMYGINQKAVNQENRSKEDQYMRYRETKNNMRDLADDQNALSNFTVNNEDPNSVFSKNSITGLQQLRQTNPGQFASLVESDLVRMGLTATPIYTKEQTIFGEDGMPEIIPSRIAGYKVVNNKQDKSRQNTVDILLDDWELGLDAVYNKIFEASGVGRNTKGDTRSFKGNTNDFMQDPQAVGANYNGIII